MSTGPWPPPAPGVRGGVEAAGRPYDRQRAPGAPGPISWEANFDELSLVDTLDMGAPWARTRLSRRAVSLLHWYAAQAVTLTGDTIPQLPAGGDS